MTGTCRNSNNIQGAEMGKLKVNALQQCTHLGVRLVAHRLLELRPPPLL